jgi:hypothetical protein
MEPLRAMTADNGGAEAQKWSPGGSVICRPTVAEDSHLNDAEDKWELYMVLNPFSNLTLYFSSEYSSHCSKKANEKIVLYCIHSSNNEGSGIYWTFFPPSSS